MLKTSVMVLLVAWIGTACASPESTGFRPPEDSYSADTAAVDGAMRPIAIVTPSFFQGVQPILGRMFANEDYAETASAVALLSHQFWSDHFASRPDAIGGRVEIRGTPHTVIGVMPQGVNTPTDVTVWVPR